MADTIEVVILAKDQVSKTIGGIRSSLGGLGNAFAPIKAIGSAAFLGVGAAAVGGFGVAMGAAINMNASLEQSTMQFTTLMGDADLAAEHVANLFEFGAKTPFETQPIIDASKHLQIFGGAALNTMDNITLVGDAAAAVGQPIDEVAFWVGRLYSNLQAGQPFGEAAMRLQELGIMTPQVRTAMEEMQATGAAGPAIWATYQEQLGSFTGAMEMQSQSWTGLTSTIKDQLSMLAADTLKPFFELLKTGLSSLSQWLASPEVQAGIQRLAEGFKTLIVSVTEFVTNSIIPFVQEHGPAIKAALIAIGVALGGLLIVGAISAAITVALNPIVLVFAAIGAAAALLKTAWDNNWGGIQEKTRAVIDFLRPFIEGAIAAIKANIEAFLTGVKAFWDAHGEAIVDTAKKAWELIKGLIEGVIKHIKLIIDAFRLAFEGDWEGLGKKIFEIWKNSWDTVVNFIRGLWDLILPIFVDLWDSLKTWFSIVDWGSLGRSIVQGIINGVKAMGGALLGALKGIVDAAIAAIKAALGIASPSRVFYEIGVNMIDGLIQAIRDKQPEVAKQIDDIFAMLGNLSNLGSGFGDLFAAQNVAPIEGALEDITGQVGTYTTAIQDMMNNLGLGAFNPDTPGVLVALQNIMNDPSSSFAEHNMANAAIALLEERQELMLQQIEIQKQLEEQQNRLLRLEMQRQQLNFLQQQFDLLKLIRDNGLDVGLLEGLTFGANADPGALMDAMIGAMTQMIGQTTNELMTIAPGPRSRSLADNFFQEAAMTAADGRGGSVVVNIDARGAGQGVEQDLRQMIRDVLDEYGSRADIRMRTT